MIDSKKQWWLFPAILALGIILDQVLKFYIKLNFTLGEEYQIFSWFRLVFVENPGMAFGVTLGSKLFLTLFRIVVSGVIVWYMVKLIKKGFNTGYLVIMTLVLTGALGNIIDCIFYGRIFTESTYNTISTIASAGNGYGDWFFGLVVDMFYFPLFTLPDWMPLLGGEIFFSPVFNLADSYITVGIICILLFYRQSFNLSLDMVGLNDKKK